MGFRKTRGGLGALRTSLFFSGESNFQIELASEYRKTMEASGIHRGRPLMARILYRYEDSNKDSCINAWTRLMELQLKGDDIIRFRNDFTEIWKQLDVSFKAQMGARVVRDLLYSKLRGSHKL